MFCTQCGASIKDGAKFCTQCGFHLKVKTEVDSARKSPAKSIQNSAFDSPKKSVDRQTVPAGSSQELGPEKSFATARDLNADKTSVSAQNDESVSFPKSSAAELQENGYIFIPPKEGAKDEKSLDFKKQSIEKLAGGFPKLKNIPKIYIGIGLGIFTVLALIGMWIYFLASSKISIDQYFNDEIEYGTLTDSRDGQIYRTIDVNGFEWMAQNLNYSSGICDSCELYGRLYTYDEAMNACPEGWVLPTAFDFSSAFAQINAGYFLSKKSDGLDAVGFSAIKGGFYSFKDRMVKRRSEIANFWLAEENLKNLALRMKLENSGEDFQINEISKAYGFSVRCVKRPEVECEDDPDYLTFVDSRDGNEYRLTVIGNRTWMAENLNYKIDDSFCYEDKSENCEKFGRLYSWENVKEICPENFHVPSNDEWAELLSSVGQQDEEMISANLEADSLWQKSGNNSSGFNALPAGYRDYYEDSYSGLGERTSFWSSSENEDEASLWELKASFNALVRTTSEKFHYYSVRCVQD